MLCDVSIGVIAAEIEVLVLKKAQCSNQTTGIAASRKKISEDVTFNCRI